MKYLKALILMVILFSGLNAARGQNRDISRDLRSRSNSDTLQVGSGSSIIDDSTRQIYGPLTIKLNTEKNIIFKRDTSVYVDTTISEYHHAFYPVEEQKFRYQDLGNTGTPLNALFFEAPEVIGGRLGIDAFDYYFIDNEEVNYYLTKSPYSWFSVYWGGQGRSITRAGYTRNINPRWNFGGEFEGYYVDKQIDRSRRGDRLTESISYHIHTNYISKSGKYRIFSNLKRTKHEFTEQGGIQIGANDIIEDFFEDTANPFLSQSTSTNFRNNFHFYHRFNLNPLFGLFHELDITSRKSSFFSDRNENDDFFDFRVIPDTASTSNEFRNLLYVENKAGITGFRKGFYYSAFLYRRDLRPEYQWGQDSLGIPLKTAENYLGFEGGWNLKNLVRIEAKAMVMDEGPYNLEGKIITPWLEGRVRQTLYQPSYLEQGYLGQYDYWVNSGFDLVRSEMAEGMIKVDLKNFQLRPKVRIVNTSKRVYFRELDVSPGVNLQRVQVFQASGSGGYFSGALEANYQFKDLEIHSEATYTDTFGPFGFTYRIPQLMLNGRIAIHRNLFDNNLEVQTGIEVHWQEDYFGMAYDPAIQQFYLQDSFNLYDYWLTSVFLNAKIRSGRLFIRMNNLRQLFNASGYFAAPNYRAVGPVFDFGFNFSFYD